MSQQVLNSKQRITKCHERRKNRQSLFTFKLNSADLASIWRIFAWFEKWNLSGHPVFLIWQSIVKICLYLYPDPKRKLNYSFNHVTQLIDFLLQNRKLSVWKKWIPDPDQGLHETIKPTYFSQLWKTRRRWCSRAFQRFDGRINFFFSKFAKISRLKVKQKSQKSQNFSKVEKNRESIFTF